MRRSPGGETEYLDDAMERILFHRGLRHRADHALHEEAMREPLIAEALRTPQTPPHHAEGPFLEDHLLLMLQTLFGILDGTLSLRGIEELARLKGYEGEIDELEETIRSRAAFYEAFALCHDIPKWTTVFFRAPEGSRGHDEGFAEDTRQHREDAGVAARVRERTRYLALYDAFAADHPDFSPIETQAAFFGTYRIAAHYGGHDKAVHAPVYRALLSRVAGRRGLGLDELNLLEAAIAHHLDPISDFAVPNQGAMLRYRALAAKHGQDPDAFADILQGCVFLDTVCGSRGRPAIGPSHDVRILMNFLRAEHDFAPRRRAEKERVREERRKRARGAIFREVGLDGVALLDVLGMEPGPAFGAALRGIHEAIVAGDPLPRFSEKIDHELARRAETYYSLALRNGDELFYDRKGDR